MAPGGKEGFRRALVLSAIAVWLQAQGTTSSCAHENRCKNGGTCIDVTEYPSPEASSLCLPGFSLYDSQKCYRVLWRSLNWTTAASACKNENAQWSLITTNEAIALSSKILKLMRDNLADNQDLWANCTLNSTNCLLDAETNYTMATEKIETRRALPVCSAEPNDSAISSQCQCGKTFIGPTCNETEHDVNLSDQLICARKPNATCPKNLHLFFDYAAFQQVDPNSKSCGPTTTPGVTVDSNSVDCPSYNASTLAVVRQLCQGKQACTLYPLLSSRHCSEENVLNVRYRCLPVDSLTCAAQGNDGTSLCSTECVRLLPNSNTWWQALEECRILGGSLAFFPPPTSESFKKLSSWLNKTLRQPLNVWIGEKGNDQACGYLQVDLDNSNISVKTERGLPCTINEHNYSLCQLPPIREGVCSPNSTLVSLADDTSACYQLVWEKSNSGEAKSKCMQYGGNLTYYDDKDAAVRRKILNVIATQHNEQQGGLWVAGRGLIRDPQGKLSAGAFMSRAQNGSWILTTPSSNRDFETTKGAICAFPLVGAKPSLPSTPIPILCMGKEGFNTTSAGQTAVKPCLKPLHGILTWKCGLNGQFEGDKPLNKCSSLNPDELKGKLENVSVDDRPNVLFDNMKAQALCSEDLTIVLDIVGDLKQKQKERLDNLTKSGNAEERKAVVEEMASSMGNVFNTLLESSSASAWTDMEEEQRGQVATNLLAQTDDFAFMLADAMVNDTHSVTKGNLVMQMSNFKVEYYDEDGVDGLKFINDSDEILLPEGFQKKSKDDDGNVKSVFVVYNNMGAILNATTFKSQDNESSDASLEVNSKVMSASLGSSNNTIQFPNGGVIVELKHLTPKPNADVGGICVFWNTKNNAWDDEGCNVSASNATFTKCECNHLTNFAVLMDIHHILPNNLHALALTWITIIGCSISIFCLSLSCIIFIFFRSLWSLRNSIHCNLCASLLAAQILLLGGLDRTENEVLCSVIAGALHFCWLSGFTWMALEGVQIYILLIKVFDTGEQKTWLYYVFGYGVPAVIIAVSAGVQPDGYGTPTYCWLSADRGFIFSFAAPMAAIFLFNMVMLIMALRAAATVKMQRQQSKTQAARLWIRRAASLIPLLGLTWVFGFLYVNGDTIAFAYLFALCNSFQGVFIFVYHCLRNEKVQQVVRRYINIKRAKLDNSSSATKSRSNSCSGTSNVRTLMTDDASSNSGQSSLFQAQSPVYTISSKAKISKPKAMSKWRQKLDVTSTTGISPENSSNGHSCVPTADRRPQEVPYTVGKTSKKNTKVPVAKGFRVRKVSELSV